MLEGNQEDSTSSSTDEEELVYNSDASSINEEVKGNPDSNPSSTNEEDTVLPNVEASVQRRFLQPQRKSVRGPGISIIVGRYQSYRYLIKCVMCCRGIKENSGTLTEQG